MTLSLTSPTTLQLSKFLPQTQQSRLNLRTFALGVPLRGMLLPRCLQDLSSNIILTAYICNTLTPRPPPFPATFLHLTYFILL